MKKSFVLVVWEGDTDTIQIVAAPGGAAAIILFVICALPTSIERLSVPMAVSG
jgi:hypothetical protein